MQLRAWLRAVEIRRARTGRAMPSFRDIAEDACTLHARCRAKALSSCAPAGAVCKMNRPELRAIDASPPKALSAIETAAGLRRPAFAPAVVRRRGKACCSSLRRSVKAIRRAHGEHRERGGRSRHAPLQPGETREVGSGTGCSIWRAVF
eukprot:1947867-Pleurochrysis_carterae.AAC.1